MFILKFYSQSLLITFSDFLQTRWFVHHIFPHYFFQASVFSPSPSLLSLGQTGDRLKNMLASFFRGCVTLHDPAWPESSLDNIERGQSIMLEFKDWPVCAWCRLVGRIPRNAGDCKFADSDIICVAKCVMLVNLVRWISQFCSCVQRNFFSFIKIVVI